MFIALDIYHELRMRRIMLPFAACPTLQYFSTLSHKRHRLKKYLAWNVFPAKLPILRRIQRDVIKNVNTSSCKVSVIRVRF